jgi:succinyl-CoA synthetase alpha subunit
VTTAVAEAVQVLVVRNTYRDSVELMRVAAEVERQAGVERAAVVMATPANLGVLATAGLLDDAARSAGPNDLVIAVAGPAEALALARSLLSGQAASPTAAATERPAPRTLTEALVEAPDARLALISTPGPYATAEALKALKRGLHVFLFSDNVSVEDEIELKALARRKGLLLMGPDCGTAILDGVPLGFANAVRRGAVGLAGASGTGLQQVTCLVDRLGSGVSQAIGLGGRDLDDRVGGSMMLAAIERLAADEETRVMVLLSKPPGPAVARRVLAAASQAGKPVVANFLGEAHEVTRQDGVVLVPTLEDAAAWAVALLAGEEPPASGAWPVELAAGVAEAAARLAPGQWRIVGLYSGGTLCKEARHLLGPEHVLLDLGDDEFTVGRPHPMIDCRLRNERIVAAAEDPSTAVILLDLVLGYGAHPDPAGETAPAIEEARRRAAADGRSVAVVASVCGTPADPQGLERQEARLRAAGVLLAPTNAAAARAAAQVVGGTR